MRSASESEGADVADAVDDVVGDGMDVGACGVGVGDGVSVGRVALAVLVGRVAATVVDGGVSVGVGERLPREHPLRHSANRAANKANKRPSWAGYLGICELRTE